MRSESALTPELQAFLRYCGVGGVGVIADGGLLALGIYAVGLGPWMARAVSTPCAVALTFALNRLWSFPNGRSRSLPIAFVAYVGVQGAGLATNLAIYAAATAVLPWPGSEPLVAFALASALALAVNYAGARLVFRENPRRRLERDAEALAPDAEVRDPP